MTDAGRLSDAIEALLLNHTHGRNTMITQELVFEFGKFRMLVESEAGEPCQAVEVNAALFLDDLMRHLTFGEIERGDVLGEDAARFVSEFGAQPVLPAPAMTVDAEV